MAALELRCPACSVTVARIPRARWVVGRPFEECPKCRTLVRRPASNEWALAGAGRRLLWIADRVAPFLVLGLAPAGVYWALEPRESRDELMVLAALLGAGPLLFAALPFRSVRHAIRRSRARMADPMYRARLVELGRRGES